MIPPDRKLAHGGGPEHWGEDRRPPFHNGGKGDTRTPKSDTQPGKVHRSDAFRRGHV